MVQTAISGENGRCTSWTSCSTNYSSKASVPCEAAEQASSAYDNLNYASNGAATGSNDPLHFRGDDDKIMKLEDTHAGLNTSLGPPTTTKASPTAEIPMTVPTKPPSCVLGIGTATPNGVVQMSDFSRDYLHGFGVDTPEIRQFCDRICKNPGILKKQIAYGREVYDENPNLMTYGAPSLDKRLELFASKAVEIATLAANHALLDWGGEKPKITHLITYSTTGMTSPALDMQLIKALGLPQAVKHFWVSMMGCHAGVVGIRTAAEIAQADENNRILVVCVEINSVQAQPLNPDNLRDLNNHVCSVIFADGAAAMVLGTQPQENETPIFELNRCHTSYIPNTDSLMTTQMLQSGLTTWLDRSVPAAVGQHSGNFVTQLLHGAELTFESVNWAVHSGGKAVIDAVERGCGLKPSKLRWSRHVLENFGNMGSPTIIFVLAEMRKEAQRANLLQGCRSNSDIHPWTVVVGFGPGLTVEGILLKNC